MAKCKRYKKGCNATIIYPSKFQGDMVTITNVRKDSVGVIHRGKTDVFNKSQLRLR